MDSYHLMQNFILNPNMWSKKYYAHAFKRKSILENLRRRIQKNFVGEKIGVKFWVIIYAYRICVSHTWVINRDFSKMSPDSLLTTTRGFREVEKPTWVNFWRESWWNTKNFAIIRFCIRQTKMAFETPFVPRGLHFKFGPSGVKVSYVSDLVVGTQSFNVIGITSINEKTSLLVSKH